MGNVMPGASVPFGMVKVSPNLLPPQPTSGYRPGRPVAGFSHTHTSGTGGGPRYGNILVIPQTGATNLENYASLRTVNERAFPGYYGIRLRRATGDVNAEITASQKCGVHRYTFFTWDRKPDIQGSIFFDVAHTLTRAGLDDSRCTEAFAEIISDTEIRGWGAFSGGWGGQNPYKVYFHASFDTPFDEYDTWDINGLRPGNRSIDRVFPDDMPVKDRRLGIRAGFELSQQQTIEVRVGISFLDMDRAKENLGETDGQTFQDVYAQTDQLWNNKLGKIQVSGGLPEHKQVFYSGLRNTLVMPTDVTGEVSGWPSNRRHFWDHYCIWDVFRTVMPLHTLIYPNTQRDILNSLLDIYDQRGWLPDAWVAGDFAQIQGGTNVDVVFADAILKNLGGFSKDKTLEAVRKNGEVESDQPHLYGRFLEDYLKLGFVTSESTNGASSRTLEYAYNDFCIGQIAREMGYDELAEKYFERSQGVFKLFHDSIGHFWAKDRQGNWMPGITSDNVRRDHWNDPFFYEASPLQYSTYVPHDMQGLINRHGGNENYIQYLNRILSPTTFELENEPHFLIPYQYIYTGRHDLTARTVQHIMRNQFLSSDDGLPGQDDSGAVSSWFVFSAMGFFPVAGQDVYLIGSPLFEQSVIHMEDGRTLEINAQNLSHHNIYIESARLNGKKLDRAWFTHGEIANGAVLEFVMTDKPGSWGKDNVPPSMSEPKQPS